MIETKKELDFYLKTDLMMNRGAFKKSLKVRLKDIIVPDYIMEYLKCLHTHFREKGDPHGIKRNGKKAALSSGGRLSDKDPE